MPQAARPATSRLVFRAPCASERRGRLCRERSFLEIRWLDLELSQLADFLAWLKPDATEDPGDFRSQQPACFAFALRCIAQDFTHFFFDASPVALRSPA